MRLGNSGYQPKFSTGDLQVSVPRSRFKWSGTGGGTSDKDTEEPVNFEGFGNPRTPERPLGGIGKTNLALVGRQPSMVGPEEREEPRGREIWQGFIPGAAPGSDSPLAGPAHLLANVMGTVADVIANTPSLAPGQGLIARGLWEADWSKRPDLIAARNQLEQQVMAGTLDSMRAMTQFHRMVAEQENQQNPGLLSDFSIPSHGLGDDLFKALNALDVVGGGRFFRRFLADNILSGKVDEVLDPGRDLEKHPLPADVMEVRERYRSGELTKDEAKDVLSQYGTVALIGGVDVEVGEAGIANVVETLAEAGLSMGMELGTDPASLLSIGIGAGSRTVVKSAETVIDDAGRVFKQQALDAAEKASRTGLTPAEREAVAQAATKEWGTLRSGGKPPRGADHEVFMREELARIRENPAGDHALREAMAQSKVWGPVVERLPSMLSGAEKVQRVIDPLTLFGTDRAARAANRRFGLKVSQGMYDGLGRGNVYNLKQRLPRLAQRIDDLLSAASANLGAQTGMALKQNDVIRGHNYDWLTNPARFGMRRIIETGSEARGLTESFVRQRLEEFLPIGPESAVRAKAQTAAILRALGLDASEATRVANEMSDGEAAVLWVAGWAEANTVLERAKLLAGEAADGEVHGDFIDRLTLVSRSYLSKDDLKPIKAALKAADASAVRQFAEQFDQLAHSVDFTKSDGEVMAQVRAIIAAGEAKGWFPQLIDMTRLPRAFRDEFAPWSEETGYRLTLQPEMRMAEDALVFDDAQRIIGSNPWYRWLDEKNAVVATGRWQTYMDALFSGITNSQIFAEATQTFRREAVTVAGMTPADASRLFRKLNDTARSAGAFTARGLTDMQVMDVYQSITGISGRRLTSRQLQDMIARSWEGNLSTVGVTTKLSGRLKRIGAGRTGGQLGRMAEVMYPFLRFVGSPLYMAMELMEMPFLLAIRGYLPVSAYIKGVAGRGESEREALRSMLGAMEYLNRTNGALRHDMNEVLMWLERDRTAASEVTGSLGRTLGSWGLSIIAPKQMRELKQYGKAIAFSREWAAQGKESLLRSAPDVWYAARAYYPKEMSDAQVLRSLIEDMAMRNDSALWSKLNYLGPVKPTWFGKRAVLQPELIRRLAIGEGWQDTSYETLKARWKADTDSLSFEAFRETAIARGADRGWLEQVEWDVFGPTTDDWFKEVETLASLTPLEAKKARAHFDKMAESMGLTTHEYLGRYFGGVPRALDSKGQFKGITLTHQAEAEMADAGYTPIARTDARVDSVQAAMRNILENSVGWTDAVARKRGDATPSRVNRLVDDTVGRPVETGLVGSTADGAVRHAYGHRTVNDILDSVMGKQGADGTISPGVLTEAQVEDAALWYRDIPRLFLQFTMGQGKSEAEAIEDAARLTLAFAVTQRQLSPQSGLWTTLQSLTALERGFAPGEAFHMVDEAMNGIWTRIRQQKSPDAARMLEEFLVGELRGKGELGQKLIDFTESFAGYRTRSLLQPYDVPDTVGADVVAAMGKRRASVDVAQSWGPVAGDIWMLRVFGFVPFKMAERVYHTIPGAAKSYLDEAGDIVIEMKEGPAQRIPAAFVIKNDQPTDAQYDYIVDMTNEFTAAVNRRMGTDYSAAEGQSILWHHAQRIWGESADGVQSMFDKMTTDLSIETVPAPGSLYADLFPPDMPEESVRLMTEALGLRFAQWAAASSGASVVVNRSGYGGFMGAATPVLHLQFIGEPKGVRQALLKMQFLGQQQQGLASTKNIRSGATKPDAEHTWAFEFQSTGSITPAQQRALIQALEGDPLVQGLGPVQYADGTVGMRAVMLDAPQVPRTQYRKDVATPEVMARLDAAAAKAGIELDGGTQVELVRYYRSDHVWDETAGAGLLDEIVKGEKDADETRRWLVDVIRPRAGALFETYLRQYHGRDTNVFRSTLGLQSPDWDPDVWGGIDPIPVTHPVSGRALLFERRGRRIRGALRQAADSDQWELAFNPRTAKADTVAHEMSHWLVIQHLMVEQLDPSYIRRIKGILAGQEGHKVGAHGTTDLYGLTLDEHEQLADMFVRFLRQGEKSGVHPSLHPLFGLFSKQTSGRKVSPEMGQLLKDISNAPRRVSSQYDLDESNLWDTLTSTARYSDRMADQLIFARTRRSWLERSLNHPYLGMYPVSYMWGKIAVEMLEFMLFRPFGLRAPGVGLAATMNVYESFARELDHNEELREYMRENESTMRMLSMFIPGTPWELPANLPVWARRLMDYMATESIRSMNGGEPKPPDEYVQGLIETMAKGVGDTLGYQYGISHTIQDFPKVLEAPGVAGSFLSRTAPPPEGEEEEEVFQMPTESAAPEPEEPGLFPQAAEDLRSALERAFQPSP